MVVPATDTWPDVTGSDVSESITFPVTTRVCAAADTAPATVRTAANRPDLNFIVPPLQCLFLRRELRWRPSTEPERKRPGFDGYDKTERNENRADRRARTSL